MKKQETINGKEVTGEQIQAWADEAEAGYDFKELKKRGRGRPGRGAVPSQVIAVRLTEEEVELLDARAQAEGTTRSDVLRKALYLATA
ncbi:MAG: ribbon-helix-helix protein, CopG family [Ancrocorticia sp.]